MKHLIMILALIIFSGCQAIMEEHNRQMATLCTYDGAFSKGVEDAENGTGSQARQVLSSCSPELKGQALRGYNHGYISITSSAPIGGPIGGFLNDVFGGSSDEVASDTLFTCEIEVFTNTYAAKGRSRDEALFNAKERCANQRHDGDFFCKKESDYSCTRLY